MNKCHECGELESGDYFTLVFGDTVWVCDFCVEARRLADKDSVIKQHSFKGLYYEPKDEKSHRKLESAEDNLREAVKRYLRNCPNGEQVLRIVHSALQQVTV